VLTWVSVRDLHLHWCVPLAQNPSCTVRRAAHERRQPPVPPFTATTETVVWSLITHTPQSHAHRTLTQSHPSQIFLFYGRRDDPRGVLLRRPTPLHRRCDFRVVLPVLDALVVYPLLARALLLLVLSCCCGGSRCITWTKQPPSSRPSR
jgi:hypothetical protein